MLLKRIYKTPCGWEKQVNEPRKPRSFVFDVRREDGRIKQITAKETASTDRRN